MSILRITYRKSSIGYARDQKATVAALGLKRLHQTVEHEDNAPIRGMIQKVRHLVSVDGVPADSPAGVRMLNERPLPAATSAEGAGS